MTDIQGWTAFEKVGVLFDLFLIVIGMTEITELMALLKSSKTEINGVLNTRREPRRRSIIGTEAVLPAVEAEQS